MRRITLLALLLLLAMVSPATPGLAHSSQPAANPPDAGIRADFNHDGFGDLAVGAPEKTVGTIERAGAVNVLYGTAGGLGATNSQFFTQVGGAAEEGDTFGYELAAGDFNRDGFADLAAAAPNEDVNGAQDAGAVSVLYGSATGLTTSGSQLFTQVGDTAESLDSFGFALTVADFNHDGFGDLAVGAPFEGVGNIQAAGAVSVLYGSATGLTTSGSQLLIQVGDRPEATDFFGIALTAGDFNHDGFGDLAAGAPNEAVGKIEAAGAVSVLYGTASGLTVRGKPLFTQVGDAPKQGDNFGNAVAAGDFNHDGFADLAVQGRGAVGVLYGSAAGLTTRGGQLLTPEQGDMLGRVVATGDFNHDGFADLAAGAPFEAVGTMEQAGAVSVLYGSATGLTTRGSQLFTQVGSTPAAFEWFGQAVASGDFNHDGFADLAADAPFDGGGAVSILYGSATGLTTSGGQLLTQSTLGIPEGNDFFGWALTA